MEADDLQGALDETLVRQRSPREVQVNLWMTEAARTHLKILARERGESISTLALMLFARGLPVLMAEWDTEETDDESR